MVNASCQPVNSLTAPIKINNKIKKINHLRIATLLLLTFALFGFSQATAQVSVNPSSLGIFLDEGETGIVSFQVQNTGSESFDFLFPGYEAATSRPAGYVPGDFADRLRAQAVPSTANDLSALMDERMSGNATASQNRSAQIMDEFLSRQNVEQTNQPLEGFDAPSFLIEFDGFTAEGGEFFLISNSPVSGMWSGVRGDFVLDNVGGQVWTNDLTVLLSVEPTLDQNVPGNAVYQIGGFISYVQQGFHLHWGTGNTTQPMDEEFYFDPQIPVENLYVWLGNGWTNGFGTWTGEIELYGLSAQPGFITEVSPATGTLAPGESIEVDALFDSNGFLGGVYESILKMETTLEGSEGIEIPVSMTVTSNPAIALSEDALDFGNVFQTLSKTLFLTVENTGNAPLTVSNISSDNPDFVPGASELTVPAFSEKTLSVTFTPANLGLSEGTLTLLSNDANNPTVTVALSGTGAETPLIGINPESVTVDIMADATATVTFDISNVGLGLLEYSIPRFANADRPSSGILLNSEMRNQPQRSLFGLIDDEVLNTSRANRAMGSFETMNDNPAPMPLNGPGYLIEMDPFTASGYHFSLIEGPVSGELSQIVADFIISVVGEDTYASDLTVLFIDTDDLGNVGYENVLFQIGGSVNFSMNKIHWGTGDSMVPGTAVQTTIALSDSFSFEDVYIWLGNGWSAHVESSWIGTIQLGGIQSDSQFITGATPATGALAAGETETITATIDASGLIEGTYLDVLSIASNDPGQPVSSFSVDLNVSGVPSLSLGSDSIDFGNVFITDTKTIGFQIVNAGTGTLELSGIGSTGDAFSVEESEVSVPPFGSRTLSVSFNPQTAGAFEGALSFSTNDPENGEVTIALSGNGVNIPIISVEPLFFELSLETGQTANVDITINNIGEGDLEYSIPRFSGEGTFGSNFRNITENRELPSSHARVMSNPENDETLRRKLMVESFRNGGLADLADEIAYYKQQFNETSGRVVESNDLFQNQNFTIGFEDFEAAGNEFFLVAEGLNGEFSGIAADFVLNSGQNLTWASDLTLLFTATPELDLNDPNGIVLQVGGTISYSNLKLGWGMGNSSQPGTAVNVTLDFGDAYEIEDVYVWMGNGWPSGGLSSWTGQIELLGLDSTVPFIADANPVTGVVSPGASTVVSLTIDPANLITGVYNDRLSIFSNDPLNPVVEVEGELTVTGIPDIAISPEVLDFGTAFTGGTVTDAVVITNSGTDVLTVTSITSDNTVFDVDESGFELAAGQSAVIEIAFSPLNPGTHNGTLTVLSDAVSGTAQVALEGNAVNPGLLGFDPDSFSFELSQGETGTAVLTLTNTGESDLQYTASTNMVFNQARSNGNTDDLDNGADRSVVSPLLNKKLGSVASGWNKTVPVGQTTQSNDTQILWYQPKQGFYGFTSTFFGALGSGLYFADSFILENSSVVQFITAYGFRYFSNIPFEDVAQGIVFRIYADDNGKPDGHPEDGMDNHVWSFAADLNTPGVDIIQGEEFEYVLDFRIDLQQAEGAGLVLGEGRYWLSVYLVSNTGTELDGRWNWYTGTGMSGFPSYFIDPADVFNAGYTQWTPATDLVSPLWANAAFKIEGVDRNFLALDPVQGVIAPGASVDLNILVDTINFELGEYEAEIRISTNSPATPLGIVPVSLTVTEGDAGLFWANLHYPSEVTIEQGQDFTVHGLAHAAHTDGAGNPYENVRMWVGFHTQNMHPGMWDESVWVEGHFHQNHDEIAEFIADVGSHLPVGTYYYSTRFQREGHPYVYGGFHKDGGGFWNSGIHVSGVANVIQSTSTEPTVEVPLEFRLRQNYPNPFNPTTMISYDIPEFSNVRLEVYNIQGQRVATLVNEAQNAGTYTVSFNASNLSSGIYLYRLQSGEFVSVQKMILVK